jgi:DNA invertase Pin-like site-specific DNA recombinase
MDKTPAKATVLRCAVYTRKSSEEGLDQSFNSLHAQREACEAYIKSQAHEGWICLPQAYDDGGFSGGSMDRPGLKALLADIAHRRVDVVVVYKVDRLTRSLADFARIVEAFEADGASFVSVTQAFNTTSSMGRLTLNVLLSFAQFEREVTGERIRDKIAASKAKGMWMGGTVPLGYDSKDRTLVVNAAEAEQVRHVFERYLALGSVDALCAELEHQGHRSKRRTTRAGEVIGGAVLTRGAIYHLLQNRTYRGDIPHKDKTYPGLHAAIIDQDLFKAVQGRLAGHRISRRQGSVRHAAAKLTGRVFWADGSPVTPTFAYGRGGRVHRYYIAKSAKGAGSPADGPPRRIPAVAFEGFVLATLRRLAGAPDADWGILLPALDRIEVRALDTHLIISSALLVAGEHPNLALDAVRGRLRQGEQALVEPGDGRGLRITTPLRSSFRGGRTWLTDDKGEAAVAVPQIRSSLVGALKQAHAILGRHGLAAGGEEALRAAKAPANPYHRKLCRLALLSPKLQRTLLEGKAPARLMLQDLLAEPPPILWSDQEVWFARVCRA